MNEVVARVWSALGTVIDPELDEPVTDLDFVAAYEVTPDGVAHVRLRLPTFYCAPNFAFLMVADAHDAVSATEGVTRADVQLIDHHASDEINGGVARRAGFVGSFEGEAVAELDDLRRLFLTKAVLAGQDRVARPLVDGGATPAELVAMTLGGVPRSVDLDRLRDRRAQLGLPHHDSAPLLMREDGTALSEAEVPLHLRRARLTRLGIETNGEYCRSLLADRYGTPGATPAHHAPARV